MTTYDTLIIGAGIAGLLAATTLQDAGHTVVVLDKGRGVGGRMATRRLPDGLGQADHGAQYFTARSAEFTPYVREWLARGWLRRWCDGFFDGDGIPHFNGDPRYVGHDGMTTVPKQLAAALPVQTGVTVTAVAWDGHFVARTADDRLFRADRLLLTPPVPQSLALLDAGGITLPAAARAGLDAVRYAPCFAVVAALDGPSAVPTPGGVWPVGGEPLAWLADNAQKGISDRPTVTLHAGPAFSAAHFDADPDDVARALLDAAAPWLGSAVVRYQVQRWRYSIPTVLHPEPFLLPDRPGALAFAGDAFAGPRVEGAARSGLLAARALLARFPRS